MHTCEGRQKIIRLILIADVIKKIVTSYATKEGKNITYLVKTSSTERERGERERDTWFFFSLN